MMWSSVRFDDEPSLMAIEVREVGEVGAERMLAAELRAVETSVAQKSPERRFRGRLRAPQYPRAKRRRSSESSHEATSTPTLDVLRDTRVAPLPPGEGPGVVAIAGVRPSGVVGVCRIPSDEDRAPSRAVLRPLLTRSALFSTGC